MSKVFFDIGANIGTTFDWLATQPDDYRNHTFFCFEPSPRHFAALLEKCREMSGKYVIYVCPFGLGGRREVTMLHEKDDPQGDSFHHWTASDHETLNRFPGYNIMASVVPLHEAIERCTVRCDEIVLDIDAEGAEYDMLHMLAQHPELVQRVKRIMVEFHFIGGLDPSARKKELIETYARAGITLECRGSVP